jgi:hypothetical protein
MTSGAGRLHARPRPRQTRWLILDERHTTPSFPELHTILTRKGATILTFPSAFTLKTGKDHWATLLKSIAITFQGSSARSRAQPRGCGLMTKFLFALSCCSLRHRVSAGVRPRSEPP